MEWLFTTKQKAFQIKWNVDPKLLTAEKDKIEEPKEEVKIELINFDEGLDETVNAIINFYDVWFEKIIDEEFKSPEKIINLIEQKWENIKAEKCVEKNDSPEETLKKCKDKKNKIDQLKMKN